MAVFIKKQKPLNESVNLMDVFQEELKNSKLNLDCVYEHIQNSISEISLDVAGIITETAVAVLSEAVDFKGTYESIKKFIKDLYERLKVGMRRIYIKIIAFVTRYFQKMDKGVDGLKKYMNDNKIAIEAGMNKVKEIAIPTVEGDFLVTELNTEGAITAIYSRDDSLLNLYKNGDVVSLLNTVDGENGKPITVAMMMANSIPEKGEIKKLVTSAMMTPYLTGETDAKAGFAKLFNQHVKNVKTTDFIAINDTVRYIELLTQLYNPDSDLLKAMKLDMEKFEIMTNAVIKLVEENNEDLYGTETLQAFAKLGEAFTTIRGTMLDVTTAYVQIGMKTVDYMIDGLSRVVSTLKKAGSKA